MKTPEERAVQSTINKITKLGYISRCEGVSYTNSAYIEVIEEGMILFKIRMSDHDLRSGNYLPAGVINEYYCPIWKAIPIKILRHYIETYLNMSEEDQYDLWQNRIV